MLITKCTYCSKFRKFKLVNVYIYKEDRKHLITVLA